MKGEDLKAWRQDHHWTQSQAARMLGTSQVNISRWEKGPWAIPPTIIILVELLRQERNVRVVEDLLYKPLDT